MVLPLHSHPDVSPHMSKGLQLGSPLLFMTCPAKMPVRRCDPTLSYPELKAGEGACLSELRGLGLLCSRRSRLMPWAASRPGRSPCSPALHRLPPSVSHLSRWSPPRWHPTAHCSCFNDRISSHQTAGKRQNFNGPQ